MTTSTCPRTPRNASGLLASALLAAALGAPPVRAETPAPRFALKSVHELATGRWPEGIALDGDVAWVADAGDRRLTAFDLAAPDPEKTVRRVKIGRLPTAMGRTRDGTILALVNTDRRVSRVRPGARRAAPWPPLPDCPEDMTVDAADRVFVLLWSRCSNADAHLARLNPKTGKATLSRALGRGAEAVTVVGERAYVAHTDGRLSTVAADTLAIVAQVAVPGMHRHVRATATAVYLDDAERLLRLDATTGALTHQATLSARIAALEVRGSGVYAALANGEIVELDEADLRVRRVLVPEAGAFEPRALSFHGEHLLVTVYGDDLDPAPREEGRLRVFEIGAPLAPPTGR